jgi:hypothetical protein
MLSSLVSGNTPPAFAPAPPLPTQLPAISTFSAGVLSETLPSIPPIPPSMQLFFPFPTLSSMVSQQPLPQPQRMFQGMPVTLPSVPFQFQRTVWSEEHVLAKLKAMYGEGSPQVSEIELFDFCLVNKRGKILVLLTSWLWKERNNGK